MPGTPDMRSLVLLRTRTIAALVMIVCALPLKAGETRRVEGLRFEALLILGSVDVEVRQGEPAELQIQGPAGVTETVKYRVDGDTLVLGINPSKDSKRMEGVRFRVIVPQLRTLELRGSGDVYVKPFEFARSDWNSPAEIFLNGSGDIKLFAVQGASVQMRVKGGGNIQAASINVEQFDAFVAGAGDVYAKELQAKEAELTVTGSGAIKVTDKSFVESLEVNIIGSGDAYLEPVDCEDAEINVVGSGDVRLGRVAHLLEASILGSGDILYSGDAELDSVELGSGEVRRRE